MLGPKFIFQARGSWGLPTNNIFAGAQHVPIAVARDADRASPLSGAWQGPDEAFNRMEVSVQVEWV